MPTPEANTEPSIWHQILGRPASHLVVNLFPRNPSFTEDRKVFPWEQINFQISLPCSQCFPQNHHLKIYKECLIHHHDIPFNVTSDQEANFKVKKMWQSAHTTECIGFRIYVITQKQLALENSGVNYWRLSNGAAGRLHPDKSGRSPGAAHALTSNQYMMLFPPQLRRTRAGRQAGEVGVLPRVSTWMNNPVKEYLPLVPQCWLTDL